MSIKVIEVTGGTFSCPHCGATWLGTWRGDRSLITCIVCKKPLKESNEKA